MVQGKPRRVALVASSFHPHTGGVETHVRAVARELAAAGDVVEVWTVDRGEHLGQDVVDGITVRYLPTPLPARDARALARFAVAVPGAVLHWWRAMRSLRPDVLHVHCFGPNGVYALALCRITRTPLVTTSHGETFADDHGIYDQSAFLRAALRRAIDDAAVVTAPTEFVLADLRSRFGLSAGVLVPNGIDPEPPPAEEATVPGTGPLVLAVGRLGWMKGFDLLLAAAADTRLSRIRVVIAGEGEQGATLRKQARELGIAHRVHFVGWLSPGQVAATMAAADVVVVPSRHEAFGIVALEAWRAGTPVIATCHGGMAEFITDNEDGLVVDPMRTDDLAGAICRLLQDSDLADRLVASGRLRVRHFSWKATVALYSTIYQSMPTERP